MKTAASTALMVAMLVLSGCSPSDVVNTGGNTKCKDYINYTDKRQTDEITKMLHDEQAVDRSGGDLTTAEIESNRVSAVTYCKTIGKPDPDSKIDEAPHAGRL